MTSIPLPMQRTVSPVRMNGHKTLPRERANLSGFKQLHTQEKFLHLIRQYKRSDPTLSAALCSS